MIPIGGLIVSSVAAFGVSAWLTSWFSRPESRFYILDHPNARSLHSRPTPRTGGIAIVAACLIAASAAAIYFGQEWEHMASLAAALLLVAVTSFFDDRVGLTPGFRMIAHLTAAAALVTGGLNLEMLALPGVMFKLPLAIGILATILFIVWMINLYNFMDGMDGFAGGMAVVGFGVFAVFGAWAGEWLFTMLNLIVAAAAAGFLFFNYPPARIFMGDTGSSSLGLLAAAFSLWGVHRVFPLWIPLLVFSPFIVDATVTLLRRAVRGEKIWEAHKTHYYQRLVQLGWGHRKTVLWEYALMVVCAASTLVGKEAMPAVQWAIVLFWIAVYALIAMAVHRLEWKKIK